MTKYLGIRPNVLKQAGDTAKVLLKMVALSQRV